jgi:hypothetical protein
MLLKTIQATAANISPVYLAYLWLRTYEEGPMDVNDFRYLFEEIGVNHEQLSSIVGNISYVLDFATSLEAMQYLIKHQGLDPNYASNTNRSTLLTRPLSLEVIKCLIEKCDANPHLSEQHERINLLHFKVSSSSMSANPSETLSILNYLINKVGLNPRSVDEETGFNVLHTACYNGAPLSIIKFLIDDIGLSAHEPSLLDQSTPLMLLSDSFSATRSSEYLETVKYLVLDKGVDVNATDYNGYTALSRFEKSIQNKLFALEDQKYVFHIFLQIFDIFRTNSSNFQNFRQSSELSEVWSVCSSPLAPSSTSSRSKRLQDDVESKVHIPRSDGNISDSVSPKRCRKL